MAREERARAHAHGLRVGWGQDRQVKADTAVEGDDGYELGEFGAPNELGGEMLGMRWGEGEGVGVDACVQCSPLALGVRVAERGARCQRVWGEGARWTRIPRVVSAPC